MIVSKAWLKDLVEVADISDVEKLLPLRTIATKEITDRFLELDMKGYNRADLLSMRGVAYEVAAITDSKVNFSEPDEVDYVWSDLKLPETPTEVEEEILSPMQFVAKIEGINVEKSPIEWVEKLTDSGFRSVNNLVDVTNLVMLEYGQPLHAFDAASVKDDKIFVRKAKSEEEIITIDGQKSRLTPEDIVLADDEKPLDIAGIMGGKETEIKDSTTSILLAASMFNPQMIRKTAQRLKLNSEASKRFYHGLTIRRMYQAFDAAIRMYQQMGGKLVAITFVGQKKDQDIDINLRHEKVNSLIGIEIEPEFIEEALTKLNFEVNQTFNDEGPKTWKVMPPYWRTDIELEVDLIEEVARMYGYEKIPAKPLEGESGEKIDNRLFEQISKLKSALVDLGLTEIQTYSFYSTRVLSSLGFDHSNKKTLIKVANPISAETEYMRQNIWPNLVEVIDKNMRHGFNDIAIFEIGKVYNLISGNIIEEYRFSLALMNDSDNPMAELNAIFNKIKGALGEPETDTEKTNTFGMFHPMRFIKIMKEGWIGGMGEVHKRILDMMGINKRVAVLEVRLKV